MPYIYIGRTTRHHGKTLWQILGNLKDYGVGRLITRGTHLHYEETCFFKIVRVFPQFHEPKNEPRKVAVWAEVVFRGKKIPELVQMRPITYKSDYQLIPKEDEHRYYESAKGKQLSPKLVPKTRPPPPLLKELFLREAASSGKKFEEPVLKLSIRTSLVNNAKLADIPFPEQQSALGTPSQVSACLYNNIDAFHRAKESLASSPPTTNSQSQA